MKVAEILAKKGPAVVTIKPSDTIAALSQLLPRDRFAALQRKHRESDPVVLEEWAAALA